ncbi:hypothetical protein ACFL1X_00695 [Candidatus Hydrogenedentota bacterium]
MRHLKHRTVKTAMLVLVGALLISSSVLGAPLKKYYDCGTAKSPVMKGYKRLTPGDMYSKTQGYGWESTGLKASVTTPQAMLKAHPMLKGGAEPGQMFGDWKKFLNAMRRDAISSAGDMVFRVDVPNGVYRVGAVVGDMSECMGSMTITINGEKVAENVASWSPGSWGAGNHRRIMMEPWGWWNPVKRTVEVKDGVIRIKVSKDQSIYDAFIAKQEIEEPAWSTRMAEESGEDEPYWRVGIHEAPYYYCGWPFVRNSLTAIEVSSYVEAPVVAEKGKLKVTSDAASSKVEDAIKKFNKKDVAGALKALKGDKSVEGAIVTLWCAGRLETEFVQDVALINKARKVLSAYTTKNPSANMIKELTRDASLFLQAWEIHSTRGEAPKGESHFIENLKALTLWQMISEESPLYYQSKLHRVRAETMLIPYFPIRGTARELLRELNKDFPDNRFVKYYMTEKWENQGDGSKYYDWYMTDYTKDVKDSPEWVKAIYPAFQNTVDMAEWWIKFKQQPEGSIGGGWGDDVEIVALFGYMGYVSRDVSDLLVKGTGRLVDGLYNYSSVDPELGYSILLHDAEHTAEFTGNTLGMMAILDYGNPLWIERSMKTAKLTRDLWTDFNDKGKRQFIANFFAAASVGDGDRCNDSWINYRAIRPANAVFWYNNSPTIGKLMAELADSWYDASMSTERGKPAGVIPTMVAYPTGQIGGHKSKNWFRAFTGQGTINQHWNGNAGYKEYLLDLFRNAHKATGDPKYFEPLRLEFELAAKHGKEPKFQAGYNLQKTPQYIEFGKRGYTDYKRKQGSPKKKKGPNPLKGLKPGSEKWVALQLGPLDAWPTIQRDMKGRDGRLPNNVTKEDIINTGLKVQSEWTWRWPICTTEAGPTDRVGFMGIINPFCAYTGGRLGGPILEAAVTYDNTGRKFAAAVLGSDAQGVRLIYYNLEDETKDVGIVPWQLEPGAKYRLVYGPDADGDDVPDKILEDKIIDFPQLGTVMRFKAEPRVNYVVEIDQVSREGKPGLAPDPGLSAEDIRLYEGYLIARIHNVGSEAVRNVWVAAYDGDPKAGGKLIGKSRIANIEAPLDLVPQTTSVGWNWKPKKAKHEIYVVVDPDDTIKNEITTFNNVAHTSLPKKEAKPAKVIQKAKPGKGGRR